MLAHDQKERLSIEQIKNHPWYTGKTPSKEDVFAELKERKKVVD